MTNSPANTSRKRALVGIGAMTLGLVLLWSNLPFLGLVVLGTGIVLLWKSQPKKSS